MHQLNKIILFVILLLLIVACEEVYEPKDLRADKNILVINGLFTDTDSSIVVNVKYADSFGAETYVGVSDAVVLLFDDFGNAFSFSTGNAKGDYTLSLRAITIDFNAEYYIHVETSNGYIYESEPQSFPANVIVNNINAEIGEKEFNMKNDAGEVITFFNEGLHLDISLKSEDQQLKYLRFADTAIYQSQYSYFEPPLVFRCATYIALSLIPVTETTININGVEQIDNKNMGFLRFINDTDYQTDNSTARVFDRWVLKSSVLSLSKETYNYYNAIIKQVSAQDKIFDPAPSQIIGNIQCRTDPEQIVLGYFDISRLKTKFVAFKWVQGEDDFKRIDLDTYKAPRESICTDTIPDFDWITFD